jgi:hypothetical protein
MERSRLHAGVRHPHRILAIDHGAIPQLADLQVLGLPGNVVQLAGADSVQIALLRYASEQTHG